MQVWNVLHAARWKYRAQNVAKNSPSAHHRTILSGYVFATDAYVVNRNKHVKQQYLLHMSSQYGELRPTSGWNRLVSLGHPNKFQRVSRLGFVTAATLLNGSQPNFARCLVVSWAGRPYIHFRGSWPVTEFCPVQNSLCVQVLHCPILAALLHGTRVVGVSQALRRWAEGTTCIRQGGHHFGYWPTF